MNARPPQGGEDPDSRTENASIGGTNPLTGPVIVWAILIGVAIIVVVLVAVGLGR